MRRVVTANRLCMSSSLGSTSVFVREQGTRSKNQGGVSRLACGAAEAGGHRPTQEGLQASAILASTPQLRPRGLQEPLPTPTASLRSRRAKTLAPVSSHSAGVPAIKSGNGKPARDFRWLPLMLLGMGVASLAIALCLVLGGVVPFQDAPAAPVSAAGEGAEVTHGSVIKLMHDKTKFRLHSHDVPYGSGSGQQSVTGFPGVEDSNSYWIVHLVKPEGKASARQGDVIPNGSTVQLQHSRTRKWLHSHLHQSPLSGNMEVSCFGGDDQSDTGDHWRLEIDGKGELWLRDQKVRLQHIDTGGYLHSHDKKYNRIVAGQQEVCGVTKKNSQNLWVAAEGVYFPFPGSANS